MQSLVLYGRVVARAVLSGFSEVQHQFSTSASNPHQAHCLPRDLHLVTGLSGLSNKSYSPTQITKKWSFGDDACFFARNKTSDVLGVADGVGGWRSYGVDPSQVPISLMSTCERLVKEGRFTPSNPTELISASYEEILLNKQQFLGSCTACVVALHREQKTLYSANLGDSGFLLIREGEVVHRSEEQQHYFNTPFQLAVAPETMVGQVLSDSPESAQTSSIGVEEGDIILVGTDGLFDNLSEEMILHHVSKLKDHKAESVQNVANVLVHDAKQLSLNPDYLSPFATNAAAYGYDDVLGGKPDDITVLLARVTQGVEIT